MWPLERYPDVALLSHFPVVRWMDPGLLGYSFVIKSLIFIFKMLYNLTLNFSECGYPVCSV